jgi:2-haloacid dehalogenase
MNQSRRSLICAALAATALPAAPAPASSYLRAVAFDGIALFDPRPVEAIARETLGDRTAAFMALWRTRQFEYTWLRTVMNRYADFAQVTAESLLFAEKTFGVTLGDHMRDRLVRAFFDLRAWPDVKPVLEELRRLGHATAIMSNFTETMLKNAIRNSGIEGLVDATLSTDRVQVFKPDARAYATTPAALSLPRERICFVAFAGWDVSGAKAFGHPVYWANRLGAMNEELGLQADFIAKDLTALPGFVQAWTAKV